MTKTAALEELSRDFSADVSRRSAFSLSPLSRKAAWHFVCPRDCGVFAFYTVDEGSLPLSRENKVFPEKFGWAGLLVVCFAI